MEVGQRVKVVRVRDRISKDTVTKLKQNSVGTVTQFKMVDGSGVGVVVEFDSGFSSWFFEDELQPA